MAAAGAVSTSSGAAGRRPGLRDCLRGAYGFATDRNDFRRNLIVNLALFAAGVWVARNMTDIDLMAPAPLA